MVDFNQLFWQTLKDSRDFRFLSSGSKLFHSVAPFQAVLLSI